eukprot:TRINITY_DN19136_c0_g1_i1.p1 TRINITY_DN19136_c0_g1~~TRINITY_DN19136_c0_g1_i1.p1  ORF type:complete len:327 (-),score=57.84 TRINITY_DN19136_c0_g1_i1:80-1060(-)
MSLTVCLPAGPESGWWVPAALQEGLEALHEECRPGPQEASSPPVRPRSSPKPSPHIPLQQELIAPPRWHPWGTTGTRGNAGLASFGMQPTVQPSPSARMTRSSSTAQARPSSSAEKVRPSKAQTMRTQNLRHPSGAAKIQAWSTRSAWEEPEAPAMERASSKGDAVVARANSKGAHMEQTHSKASSSKAAPLQRASSKTAAMQRTSSKTARMERTSSKTAPMERTASKSSVQVERATSKSASQAAAALVYETSTEAAFGDFDIARALSPQSFWLEKDRPNPRVRECFRSKNACFVGGESGRWNGGLRLIYGAEPGQQALKCCFITA